MTHPSPQVALRKEFWFQFLDSNQITQVWLALAPSSQVIAQKNLGLKKGDYSFLEKTKRVSWVDAAVIVRIGRAVMVDWAPMGKCRLWLEKNEHKPKFFKPTYCRHDLVCLPDYTQQHYFSELGLWQKDLSRWMKKNNVV